MQTSNTDGFNEIYMQNFIFPAFFFICINVPLLVTYSKSPTQIKFPMHKLKSLWILLLIPNRAVTRIEQTYIYSYNWNMNGTRFDGSVMLIVFIRRTLRKIFAKVFYQRSLAVSWFKIRELITNNSILSSRKPGIVKILFCWNWRETSA